MGDRMRHLDDRADGWVRRHQSWRTALTVLTVETIFSVVLAVSLAGFGVWWIGPLAWFGLAPVFVLFVPLRRGGRLSRLDDRFIGWARKTPVE